MSDPTAWARFWAKVDASGVCWIFTGAMSDTGYGSFRYMGGAKNAHTVAWNLLVGEVPDGMHLDHLCRNRACCNPDHLEVVTPAENARRAWHANTVKAKCKKGHPFTDDNTYIGRRSNGSTFRKCVTCTLARQAQPEVRERHNELRRQRRNARRR